MKPTLMRRLTVAALTAAAVLSASACAVTASKSEVESKALEALRSQGAESVSCPGDLKGEVGASIRCTVNLPQGQSVPVNVKVTSVEGTTVNFEVKPVAQ